MLFKKNNNNKSTLLNRMLILVLLPMFLAQIFSFYIFFRRCWEKISKKNLGFIVNEIVILNRQFDIQKEKKYSYYEITNSLNNYTVLDVNIIENRKTLDNLVKTEYHEYEPIIFLNQIKELSNYVDKSFIEDTYMSKDKNSIQVVLDKGDCLLSFNIPYEKIYIIRLDLIIFWNCIVYCLFSIISIMFVRNQVKSIDKLKKFVNDFSFLEKENNNFKPTGAKEIREIGKAFLNMINKIKYLINSRTVMLAQISHDLRTPLTRMKLQTEFINDKTTTDYFKKDLKEMDDLINEYILFAKGENEKEYNKVNIKDFFEEILKNYYRSGYKNIEIIYNNTINEFFIKKISFTRAINNLINNSLKYGKKSILLTINSLKNKIQIIIEDDGGGLSKDAIKKAKKPFFILNEIKTEIPSNGLGLSIVQQIITNHYGIMKFGESKKLGGLLVSITIPINNKKDKKYVKKYSKED